MWDNHLVGNDVANTKRIFKMKSKTADSWADFFAELERETNEVIAKLNTEPPELDLDYLDKLLAVSEEEDKAFFASLEDEPLIELPALDLELLDCAW